MALLPVPTALTLLATTTLTAALLYLRHRYHLLRSKITTRTLSPSDRQHAISSHALSSLPPDLLAHPEAYRILHTQDCIPLSPTLTTFLQAPENRPLAKTLFTRLMRRNMHAFALYLPQSYVLRLLARTREQRLSFSRANIATLDFVVGDLACGVYRVLVREATRCEMGMDVTCSPLKGLPDSFGGRLVTALVPASEGYGKGAALQTETLQWVSLLDEGAGFVLPLERRAVRWLHELASWGLLVEGRWWLQGEVRRLEGEEKRTEKVTEGVR